MTPFKRGLCNSSLTHALLCHLPATHTVKTKDHYLHNAWDLKFHNSGKKLATKEYKMRNRGRKCLLLAKAIPRHPGIQSIACLLPGKLGSKSMSYLHKINKAAKQEHINLKGKIAQHLMYFNKRTYWRFILEIINLLNFHQLLQNLCLQLCLLPSALL